MQKDARGPVVEPRNSVVSKDRLLHDTLLNIMCIVRTNYRETFTRRYLATPQCLVNG